MKNLTETASRYLETMISWRTDEYIFGGTPEQNELLKAGLLKKFEIQVGPANKPVAKVRVITVPCPKCGLHDASGRRVKGSTAENTLCSDCERN